MIDFIKARRIAEIMDMFHCSREDAEGIYHIECDEKKLIAMYHEIIYLELYTRDGMNSFESFMKEEQEYTGTRYEQLKFLREYWSNLVNTDDIL